MRLQQMSNFISIKALYRESLQGVRGDLFTCRKKHVTVRLALCSIIYAKAKKRTHSRRPQRHRGVEGGGVDR